MSYFRFFDSTHNRYISKGIIVERCIGNDIYENDIVEDKDGNIALVMFINGAFVLHTQEHRNEIFYNGYGLKKIGNIRENPELFWDKKERPKFQHCVDYNEARKIMTRTNI